MSLGLFDRYVPSQGVVLAVNSWGGKSPILFITKDIYMSHYIVDPSIVTCWDPSDLEQPTAFPETKAYLRSTQLAIESMGRRDLPLDQVLLLVSDLVRSLFRLLPVPY